MAGRNRAPLAPISNLTSTPLNPQRSELRFGEPTTTYKEFRKKYSRRELYGPLLQSALRLWLSSEHRKASKDFRERIDGEATTVHRSRRSLSLFADHVELDITRKGRHLRARRLLTDTAAGAGLIALTVGGGIEATHLLQDSSPTDRQATLHNSNRNGGIILGESDNSKQPPLGAESKAAKGKDSKKVHELVHGTLACSGNVAVTVVESDLRGHATPASIAAFAMQRETGMPYSDALNKKEEKWLWHDVQNQYNAGQEIAATPGASFIAPKSCEEN